MNKLLLSISALHAGCGATATIAAPVPAPAPASAPATVVEPEPAGPYVACESDTMVTDAALALRSWWLNDMTSHIYQGKAKDFRGHAYAAYAAACLAASRDDHATAISLLQPLTRSECALGAAALAAASDDERQCRWSAEERALIATAVLPAVDSAALAMQRAISSADAKAIAPFLDAKVFVVAHNSNADDGLGSTTAQVISKRDALAKEKSRIPGLIVDRFLGCSGGCCTWQLPHFLRHSESYLTRVCVDLSDGQRKLVLLELVDG